MHDILHAYALSASPFITPIHMACGSASCLSVHAYGSLLRVHAYGSCLSVHAYGSLLRSALVNARLPLD